MAGLIVLVLAFDYLQGSVVLSVDPDEESGLSDRAHFLSDYLAVGEDKIVVLFFQGDGGELRLFIRGGVHDRDDEFLREIQRGLLVPHDSAVTEHAVEGSFVHDFTGERTRRFGGGEKVLQLFEGDGDGFGFLLAGDKADDGQQD